MSFFDEELTRRIRYLHFKIKHLENALDREDESFKLDDLNLILEYTRILNINYQNENHLRILKKLEITPAFQDPKDNKSIEIKDIMFECARALWVLARAYSHLSENYEKENDWENAIIAMVESSKMFKTAAYFSAAAVYQRDFGTTLDPRNLELNSEEARTLAQSIAALKEETSNNKYFASKLYSGLSHLSKRIFYLKNHDEKKRHQLRAQFHYDMGKSCQLKAQASIESSITPLRKDKIKKLQQKAKFYYEKAKEIWNDMLNNISNLTEGETESIQDNISIVEDHLNELDVETLDYENIKKIQDPEPIIIIPENLAPFVPKNTVYLTKFVPKDLNVKRFKEFMSKKLEPKITYSKREKLIDKKAGIVRTINELKILRENNEITVEKFAELMEKYTTKLNMIDTAIEKLAKQ
ncbi:MAG: hypothetical protein ACTSRH_00620 [Promethearchaeota archaeon]